MSRSVVIYNEFFDTAGGGERSCLAFAKGFEELGFKAHLVSNGSNKISLETLSRRFSIFPGTTDTILYMETEEEIRNFINEKNPDIFLNHSFGSTMNAPIENSHYMAMFPKNNLNFNKNFLSTYKVFICNSRFTERYLKRYWGGHLKTMVIIPPVISNLESKSNSAGKIKKDLNILLVGRFDLDGHNKCQLEAISSFRELVKQPKFSNWKLTLIGSLLDSSTSAQYLEACKLEATGLNVEFILDADFLTLENAYRESSFLWQCTGMHLPAGFHPELCEHLGLVSIDALTYGCIPIIYQRSGAAEELYFGVNCFFFSDKKELLEITSVLSDLCHEQDVRFRHTLQKSSVQFSFDNFVKKLESILS
ncbi:MAG TPA: glycosyltransferase [Oligoflexia bacterium]|nr:glycosyltransferase [Oligoflexia bacterium]HMP49044.1 glycosyltransferase [Oligoflexia bacterium]